MAEKTIKGRFKQRYDTLANWQKVWSTLVPLTGEVCVFQIPANTVVSGLTTSTEVRHMSKVGDGKTTLEKLPWNSAISATLTNVDAVASDDGVVNLTGSGGNGIVSFSASHAAKGPSSGYTSGNTTTSISGSGGSGTIKVPQITVDKYGHVTAAADEDVKITLPTVPSLSKGTDDTDTKTLTHGGTFTAVTDTTVSGHTITDTTTTYTLPVETAVSTTQKTGTASTATDGSINVVTAVAKGSSSHGIDVTTTKITLPGETSLSKEEDTTESVTLAHGGKFTAVTDTAVSGHKITNTVTTYTVPGETSITTDQLTGTAKTASHGGAIDVVTAVAKGDSSHNVDVTTTKITLPSETNLSKGTNTTDTKTLTHGGTFTATTGSAVSGHKITDTVTTYTLPAETAVSVTKETGTGVTGTVGGTINVITDITKGDSSHEVKATTTAIKLPAETAVSVDTLTATTQTLAHGGTFSALTSAVKGSTSHNVDVTPTTFTLPGETELTVDQGTATTASPTAGGTLTVVTGVTKGDTGHNLDIAKTTITFPKETALSKGTDATDTTTLAHGGTFTAITDTAVSAHKITDTKTTFTLPAETSLSKGTSTTASKSLNHGDTFTATTASAVSGHKITDTVTTYTLPTETALSKGTDTTDSKTLAHGGTFTAVTDTAVSGHKITDTTTTYTLPAETTLSKGTNATASKSLSHGGTFTATTSSAVSNHTITDTVTTYTLPSETSLSKGTDTTDTKTLTHGGTFTATTGSAVSGHKITDTVTTYTLPAETSLSVSTTGSGNAITGITVSNHAITATKGTTFLTAHPAITTSTDTTSTQTATAGGKVTVVDGVTRDTNGHVTAINTKTVTLPAASTSVSGNAGTATKLQTARTIDGISFDGSAAISHFGTCETAAGTKAKVATVDGTFSLVKGATVYIKMTAANSIASPTLNVNGTGDKSIYRYGTTAPSTSATSSWNAGAIVQFVYDGSAWFIAGWLNNNTTYSVMTGASSGAAGANGLVPAPAAGDQAKFLRGDGTWVVPTNTTYTFTNKAATLAWGAATSVATVGGTDITVALPANPNTDTKVTQAAAITTDGAYPVLLGYSTATTAVTNTVNKSSKLTFNPSSGVLTATSFAGNGASLTALNGSNISTGTVAVGRLPVMGKATASAGGTAGIVPASAAGDQTKFLRADGTWVVPTNTTYSFSNKAATLAWGTTSTLATVGGTDITVTMPANPNSDTKVTQAAAITTAGEYPVLLANSTATTAVTNTVNKAAAFTFNPSTGVLSATQFKGSGAGLTNVPFSALPTGTTATTVAIGNHTHTASAVGAAASSHAHGNITNAGAITATGVALASGDALVFSDSSDSSKLVKSSITFDGSTTTKFLSQKGSWETPVNTTYTFTNKAATLAWGTTSTLATVGGTDITVTMPANPNTNTNYYPTTFTWTAGTTAGPTGSLTGSGMSAVSFAAIPSANGTTASGIVTTGSQTFGGTKTFSSSPNVPGIIITDSSDASRHINYKSSTRSGNAISFIPGNANGSGVRIGDGGLVVIGAGESGPSLITAENLSATTEQLHLAADSSITLWTNCNTIADRKKVSIDTAGTVTATKFSGALSGNATTATTLATARTLSVSLLSTANATFNGGANATLKISEVSYNSSTDTVTFA